MIQNTSIFTRVAIAWLSIISAFLILVFSPFAISEVRLPDLEDPPLVQIPLDPDSPDPSCDQIEERLTALFEAQLRQNAAVDSFLYQITDKLSEWYDLLNPFEDSNDRIPTGTFTVLQTGAEKIRTVTDMSSDNNSRLVIEFDKIIGALAGCQITERPAQKRP